MKNIAIIPARGGSKRIPHKNIKKFFGKPIIAYSIEAAINCELFDEVMVSTDDKEIADVALKYGAKVPFLRSSENADDYSTVLDVLKEVLNKYTKSERFFENACTILPTSPLINTNCIIQCYKILTENNYNVVHPVIQYNHPIQKAFTISNNQLRSLAKLNESARTQDMEATFHDAGMFYWRKINTIGDPLVKYGFILSELHSQDIDSEEDWILAELKYKYLNKYQQYE